MAWSGRTGMIPPSADELVFGAAQCKLMLGDLLDSARQAAVYTLVCLRPGQPYYYYAQHSWGSYSGKVFDELESLARKRLIWYVVSGHMKMKSLVGGSQEFKEKRMWYPTHEFLARTGDVKKGTTRWLLDEYNQVLRSSIERVRGRSSPSEPCIIVCWKKKDMDIATAKINVAKAKVATIAVCGDLDGWREFIGPYKQLEGDNRPVSVIHVENKSYTKSNAEMLRDETGADIRPVIGSDGSFAMGQSRRLVLQILDRVTRLPWMRVTIKPTPQPSGATLRHFCRLNLVDDTLVLPVYEPGSQYLNEYKAIILRHPDVANQLYQIFGKVFNRVAGLTLNS